MCDLCGTGFERVEDLERHQAEAHADATTHAIDVERALKGLPFPLGREDLLDRLRASDPIMADRLRELPEQVYPDPAAVARIFDGLHGQRDAAGDQH